MSERKIDYYFLNLKLINFEESDLLSLTLAKVYRYRI